MDALRVLLETSTFNEVLRGLAISILLAKLVKPTTTISKSQDSTFITASGFLLIYFFARSWLALVNHYAPEPYLVRNSLAMAQVQSLILTYCRTKSSTSPKPKHTVKAATMNGTTKSPRPPACTSSP